MGTHRRDGSGRSRARNGHSAAPLLLRRRRSDVRARRRRRSGGRTVRRTRPTVARFVCLLFPLCVICPFLPPGLRAYSRSKRRVNAITAVNEAPPAILYSHHGFALETLRILVFAGMVLLSPGVTTRKIATCTLWCIAPCSLVHRTRQG